MANKTFDQYTFYIKEKQFLPKLEELRSKLYNFTFRLEDNDGASLAMFAQEDGNLDFYKFEELLDKHAEEFKNTFNRGTSTYGAFIINIDGEVKNNRFNMCLEVPWSNAHALVELVLTNYHGILFSHDAVGDFEGNWRYDPDKLFDDNWPDEV